MNSSAARSATTIVVAATLVLIAGSDTGPGLAADSLLQAQQISIDGKTVQLRLANPGDQTVTETIRVRVVAGGNKVMTANRTVTVGAGKTLTVAVAFPSPVRGIIELGVILDDGAPF